MEGSNNKSGSRPALPSAHERQEDANVAPERVVDISMTYSEDVSPSQLYTKDSLPLIELDSSDEEDFLIDSPIGGGDKHKEASPPKQRLMLPRLEKDYDQRPCRNDLDGDLLDSAFDDAIRETKKKAASPKRPPIGTSGARTSATKTSDRSMAEKFNFPAATLSPIHMCRSSSTPTKISSRAMKKQQRAFSPKALTPPLSDTRIKKPRANSVLANSVLAVPMATAYSLRRQISLPSRDRSPLLLSPDGYVENSISSESSSDDEIAQLAHELATPKSRDRSNIFRSARSRTPTNFRRGSNASAAASKVVSPEHRRLQRNDTGKTDGSDDELGGLELASTEDADNREIITARRRNGRLVLSPLQIDQDQNDRGGLEDTQESLSTREFQPFLQRRSVQYVIYLSTFACFGTIIRVFCARFFGLDCELNKVNDWLLPLSRHICVTSSGTTEQSGGALFIDLPANMLGSFIMGLLTVLKPDVWPPIPWLKRDHPLQQHDALHVAIKTGMCGSLTTFASWNTQMVVMMDGSQTVLGPQIMAGMFGYLLGIMASVASFLFGTHCSTWLNNWRNPESSAHPKRDVENPPLSSIHFPQLGVSQSACYQFMKSRVIGRTLPFLILGVLLALFLMADFVFDSTFYRILWLEVLFTPPGALLRWSLSARLNGFTLRDGWDWLPMGTLTANLLGSFISILLLAVEFRTNSISMPWAMQVLAAIRVGTAGSLSTVSTFVKELVDTTNRYPHEAKAYYYGFISIGGAMFLSLIVYIPIVRTG